MSGVLEDIRRSVVRALAAAVVTALLVTGCSDPSSDSDTPAGSTTGAAQESDGSEEPSPTRSKSAPTGPRTTAPGTVLSFGDTATVEHELRKDKALLKLTVQSATQGSLQDFEGFDLDDPYKRRGSYYYVRVAVRNAGKGKVGDVPVPLWGLSGEGTLLQVVQFRSAFSTCPTEPLPEDFGPGDRFETCLVYLSPNRGSLEGVSYRPTVDFSPIEWRGKVKTLPTKKPGKGSGKGGGQGSGQGDGQDG
ncbi:MAG: hypothetical protein AVDCRST_MAG34-653 [uncultured Nocardioidaceae bacterium]|uniref:DUF4352 domain-containing protein n=1 Tax=uncultured Nocardioidaceae bacterium TaxID=253824 RepID=A0A6J4LS53_9ACTN|nr:MAG: hypothetical protein AVDCRST_MAG34-653 [uncultured Nocardioidaceae bacterium]